MVWADGIVFHVVLYYPSPLVGDEFSQELRRFAALYILHWKTHKKTKQKETKQDLDNATK